MPWTDAFMAQYQAAMGREAVELLRDRKEDKPEAANGRVKAVRQVFKWAMKTGPDPRPAGNPARDVEYLRGTGAGFHTWSVEEVLQFARAHPVGTKAWLAVALLLFTGCRRSDVVTLGRPHLRDGVLHYTQHKNRRRKPVTLDLPILPELRTAIDAYTVPPARGPVALTLLVTEFGKPFTPGGFGNRFKEWCRQAGLPHCSAHGLRKAGGTIVAENGATINQLMAIFGWRTEKQAMH